MHTDQALLGLLASVAIVAGLWVIVQDLRRRDIRASTLFVAVSIVFVNIGMFIRWIESDKEGFASWHGSGSLVASLGLLTFIAGSSAAQALSGFTARSTDGS